MVFLDLFKNFSVCCNCYNLPGQGFTTCLDCVFYCILKTAAAGDFHTDYLYTLYIVVLYNLGEFFRVISFVKFGATNESDVIADEVIVEVAVGIGCAVCSNKEICVLKVGSVDRNKFYLTRPLGEKTWCIPGLLGNA